MIKVSTPSARYVSMGETYMCEASEFNRTVEDYIKDGDVLMTINGDNVEGYYTAYNGRWREL